MKLKLIMTGVLLSLAACTSNQPKVDTVRSEELSIDFVAEGIKVTSANCNTLGRLMGRQCMIVAIESTSTAPSNGGTTVNRKNAMDAACSYALANVRHWMGERVESSRSVRRSGTSTELSQSKELQNSNKEVGAGESSNRENANDTTTEVTNAVRRSASGFMQGWQPVKQNVIGPQEVSCTMGWNVNNTMLMNSARGL